MSHNRLDEAMVRIEEALRVEPAKKEYLKLKAQIYEMQGNKSQANELLRELADDDSDPWLSYGLMCRNYEELGLYDSALLVMKQFQMLHPGDRRAAAAISRLEQLKKESKKDSAKTPVSDSPQGGVL